MKLIDKFLKKLKTDRNTFATYIFTLITIYLAVDRLVEMLFMIFTGVANSYWGPIEYTLALACPILAFLFSGASAFATSKKKKVTMFYLYVIGLYIIAISMFTQWMNFIAWLLLILSPNYVEIVTEFSDLVGPAFTSISLYLPLLTIFPLFKWLFFGINDSKDQTRSIWDYGGIDLSDKKIGTGPYTCETYLCANDETGQSIKIPDNSRFLPTFVCGGSGSGKTSLVFEPLIARDLERKFFLKEVSKELGYTALKTKIATLDAPYGNEYLNKNFRLDMLKPSFGKDTVYKAFMKKMLLSISPEYIYRNVGITVMSPDYEIIDHMKDVSENFGFSYNMIDPENPNSVGLNPFVYDDPGKIAVTISSALKGMYNDRHEELEEAFREDVAIQAIENIAILLKEMYPRMNEGALPNMEDMLKLLSNFELVEKMCEIMAHNETLSKKYEIQLSYFKKYFYKDGSGKTIMEQNLFAATSQLDNLLRLPGVKTILCNRHTNIDFDKMLSHGEITFLCTRRGDLGLTAHKAFGLFFLIAMENAVLRRPGNINTRVPNFLYIDEFPDFISKSTEAIFTMYRKYKVGTVISAQSLSQLDTPNSKTNYRNTILANCSNKILTGNGPYDELEWWSDEFGTHREWVYSNSMDMEKMKYDSKYSSVKWDFVKYFKPGKLQSSLGNKNFAYKITSSAGKPLVGLGKSNYLDSKYKEKQHSKFFDFDKYLEGNPDTPDDDENSKKKFDLKNLSFKDERDEIDPIKMNTTDSKYLFDNEDAIVVNFNKKKK